MPPHRSFFRAGDLNAFFALMFDNVANLVILATILIGAFHFPRDIVLERMVPGTAVGVLIGDLVYAFLARRLSRRTGRDDVTAMPLGVNAPSVFGMSFAVLGPAYLATGDAVLSWKMGMAVTVLVGLFKTGLALSGNAVRNALPRAALLGSIGGAGIALIGLLPLLKVFADPIVGFVGLGIILVTLLGRVRLPGGLPGAFISVIAAVAVSLVLSAAGFHSPLLAPVVHESAPLHLSVPWPSLAFLGGLPLAWVYLPIALPFALSTIVGGIDNTESAAAAGDEYDTRAILATEGLCTVAAGLCGGVVESTPYIGHPAYKKMGAGAGYAVATGLFVGLGGILGYLPLLVDWIPAAAVAPILIYIGIEVLAQAFVHRDSVPARGRRRDRHPAVSRVRHRARSEGAPAAGRRFTGRRNRRDAARADPAGERLRRRRPRLGRSDRGPHRPALLPKRGRLLRRGPSLPLRRDPLFGPDRDSLSALARRLECPISLRRGLRRPRPHRALRLARPRGRPRESFLTARPQRRSVFRCCRSSTDRSGSASSILLRRRPSQRTRSWDLWFERRPRWPATRAKWRPSLKGCCGRSRAVVILERREGSASDRRCRCGCTGERMGRIESLSGSYSMTLSAGTRLGPYEILSPLGAGGMGEVYRARDSKLKRDVAVKVLPKSLAADADALARFEREALAVAALSHPNILAIFDFGTHEGMACGSFWRGDAAREARHGPIVRGKLSITHPDRQGSVRGARRGSSTGT
jgi:AGZA family xanthine/uracil permease-like MFS transporter